MAPTEPSPGKAREGLSRDRSDDLHDRAPSLPLALATLGLCAALGPLGIHAPVPLLTRVAESLGTSYATAQAGVSAYVLALALSQLAIGLLSARYPPITILRIGLAVHLAASLGIAQSDGVFAWLASRALQGASSSVGMVVSLAVIGALAGAQTTRRSGVLMAWLAAVTVVTTFASGAIEALAGWRAVFWATAVLTGGCLILSLLTLRGLPGIQLPERRAATDTIRQLLCRRSFLSPALAFAIAVGAYYYQLALLPYLADRDLGLSPYELGRTLLYASLAMPATALLAAWFGGGQRAPWRIVVMSGLMTLAALGATIAVLGSPIPTALLFSALAVQMAAMTFISVLGQAAAISAVPSLSGPAAGLAGLLQFSLAAALGSLGGLVIEGTASAPLAMGLAAAACGFATFAAAINPYLYLKGRKP